MTAICTFPELDTKQFEDVVQTLGYTRLAKYPSVRIYRQIESRTGLLQRMKIYMEKYYEEFLKNFTIQTDSELRYWSYYHALENQIAYVAECRTQLDINNTIDSLPYGDLAYSRTPDQHDALFTHTVQPFTPLFKHWNEYFMNYQEKFLWAMYSEYMKKPQGVYDRAAAMLVKSTYAGRRASILARLQWELRCRHHQGWFMVFDTLTLSPDMQASFHAYKHNLRDYFRSIGNSILQAEGRSTANSHSDCYTYFCVPEFGSQNGRLHFHCIHFMRTLPKGSRDPNLGKPLPLLRQLDSLRGFWKFGHSLPVAIRYHNDNFTRKLQWRWPTDKQGIGIACKPYAAVGFYVTKYVCKNVDFMQQDSHKRRQNRDVLDFLKPLEHDPKNFIDNVDISHVKGEQSCLTTLQPVLRKQTRNDFRVRMSRNLGQTSIPTQDLSIPALLELTRLHYSVTPYTMLIKKKSRDELLSRIGKTSIEEIRRFASPTSNLLQSLRSMMKTTTESNLQSFMSTARPYLGEEDISDEVREWLHLQRLDQHAVKYERGSSREHFGGR